MRIQNLNILLVAHDLHLDALHEEHFSLGWVAGVRLAVHHNAVYESVIKHALDEEYGFFAFGEALECKFKRNQGTSGARGVSFEHNLVLADGLNEGVDPFLEHGSASPEQENAGHVVDDAAELLADGYFLTLLFPVLSTCTDPEESAGEGTELLEVLEVQVPAGAIELGIEWW